MQTMVDSEINQHQSVFELKVLYNFKTVVTLKYSQPIIKITKNKKNKKKKIHSNKAITQNSSKNTLHLNVCCCLE